MVPPSARVKEGDNVTLVCEADGNPPPIFTFFKKNVRLEGTVAPFPWQTSAGCSLSPAWSVLGRGLQWLGGRGPVWG